MKTRLLLPLMAVAISVPMPGQSLAQSRTDMICWAESASACGPQYTIHYPCGSGGHSGFNPTYACQQVCGQNPGPRCRVTGGPGGEGGQCGYRGAKVECF
jgi:hypothetical protein